MTSQADGDSLRAEVAGNGAEGQLLARIDERVGQGLRAQERTDAKVDTVVKDVGDIKVAQAASDATQTAKWDEQDRVNADLRQKKNLGDAAAYVLGGVGTILAAVGLKGGS